MREAALAFLLFSLPALTQGQAIRVEPPGWWPGHSINPVRLLVTGKGLAGVKLKAPEGLRLGTPKVSADGAYLFVDARILPGAKPGPRSIAGAEFKVYAPLERKGRFGGLSSDDVLYMAMTDRFANGDPANDAPAKSPRAFDRRSIRFYHGGDLRGAEARLDYLKDLGVTALWLTPLYDNADEPYPPSKDVPVPYTDYHGYEATDYYAVDEHFGSLGDLRSLADQAHARGLKLVLDQVANHVGPKHPWVAAPPTPTWFNGTAENHLANDWRGWTLISPHASPQTQASVLKGWYAGILPDLNQEDPEVARYLIQNSLWWLGVSGADALRLDTASFLPRRFLADWMKAVKREFPTATTVGEAYGEDPAYASFFQGGAKRFDGVDSGLDTVLDIPLQHALHEALLGGRSLSEVPQLLMHDFLYPHPGLLVTQVGSHDETRFMSRPGADAAKLGLAFGLLFTMRGLPLVYYGDELAMRGGPGGGLDPENRRDFPGSALTREGRSSEQEAVFSKVRTLARLRAELSPLRRGRQVDLLVGDSTYVFARVDGSSWAVVAVNSGAEPASLDVETGPVAFPASGTPLPDRLGGASARVEGGRLRAAVAPRSVAVFTAP